jgi:hypothetical protein
MALINVNQLLRVQTVQIRGCFHKFLLCLITWKRFENTGLSALPALSSLTGVAK